MKKIVIRNVDLMTEDEEENLKRVLKELNVKFDVVTSTIEVV